MFMMILASALATNPAPAAAPAQPSVIQGCSVAMRLLGRVPPELIQTACPQPGKVDLWAGDDTSHRCDGAITFARDIAKSAQGLPTVMIDGMIREFDKRVANCTKPVDKTPLPVTDCKTHPQLWC